MKQLAYLLLLLALSAPLPGLAKDAPRCVTIAGTNDLHGAITPQHLKQFDKTLRWGGVLAQSGYVQRLRDVYGDRLLLLDGGDLFQGTMVSNLSRGEAVITAYNEMGYTASAIGNHEFDYGPLTPEDPDRLGVFKERLRQATFPFLAANIRDRRTQKPVDWPNTRPSMLIERGGVRVGIIGISTPQTPKTTRPQNILELEFLEPLPIVREEAQRLRRQGAELVILITHMGDKCRDLTTPDSLSSCEGSGELFPLLQQLPRGLVDVAIGGHTHGFVSHWVHGTATIESGGHGRYLGWLEACVDAQGKFDREATTLHRPRRLCIDTWSSGKCEKAASASALQAAKFLGKTVQPTERMQDLMRPYLDQVTRKKEEPLGVVLPTAMHRATRGHSPLGLMVAQAAREELKADVGIQNRGGVRTDLPKGALTYGMVFRVLPFGNHLASLHLTGKQLRQFIQQLTHRRKGALPYISGIDVQRSAKGLILRHKNGKPLDPRKTYHVATSDFLAGGGEGTGFIWDTVPTEKMRTDSVKLREAMIKLLQRTHPAPSKALLSPEGNKVQGPLE